MRWQSRTQREQALSELVDRQWGVVSMAQLLGLGFSAGAVQHRLTAGRLHRVHRGVYAAGHTALRVEGRRLAAVLACGPDAILSHVSAASHWGLLHTDQAGIDVTAPASRHGTAGIRLHRSRSLDALDITHHRGIPITTVPRTMLDLAATAPKRLENALAQAEQLRLYDLTALRSVVDRSKGHRGRGALTRALAHEPRLTRSELEAKVLASIREAGLPEPLTNLTLAAHDHEPYEVDLYFPTHRLVVETDGWETHRTRRAFERDRAKDAALTAAGYRVMRFTARTDAATVVRRIEAALRHSAARSSRNSSSSTSSIE